MSLLTPALSVDAAIVARNAARVAAYATAHGLSWRPHVKTHKSPWVAAQQLASGARGLTCATPHEAEVMREATSDLLLAYPPVGAGRLARIAELAPHAALGVMLDSAAAASGLSGVLSARGASVGVIVELDAGMHRTGVVGVAAAVALARAVDALPALTFEGFGFYPGHLRDAGPGADGELARLSALVTELRAAASASGLDVRTVSCGSTPLLWRSHEIAGMTELRAGTAAYFDRTSVLGGVCAEEDCAATVIATVVSVAVPGQAVVDAGVKALGRESIRGSSSAPGYAAVQGRPEVPVVRLSEEHGILDLTATDWRPRLGEQVHLLPNHICIAVHCFDTMQVRHPDGRIETMPIAARGR